MFKLFIVPCIDFHFCTYSAKKVLLVKEKQQQNFRSWLCTEIKILRIISTSPIFFPHCKIQQHLCLGQSGCKVCSSISPFEISSLRMSLNKAKAVAQRKILAAAQSREANMALVLVCTVLMFIICHAPRLFTSRYVFISFL